MSVTAAVWGDSLPAHHTGGGAVSPLAVRTDISTVTTPFCTCPLVSLTCGLLVLLSLTLAIREAWQLRAVVFSLLRSTVLPCGLWATEEI